ncbi:hypothetical protein IE81DRAFT_344038 [Ceraceosorus guamensis]|uniref:Uncharacterized protein n=1 Tax=Ceraceosorus guamensis TaxID=1522189 RepID=A0A316W958_9BASI|nr:hypothetical protein IE81DRAFT_344038 [Ceraceosorus guamensis]PWN46429.1 hypothetical protein IE81DRAFT_344038 [Ceraceosorus guamensis]
MSLIESVHGKGPEEGDDYCEGDQGGKSGNSDELDQDLIHIDDPDLGLAPLGAQLRSPSPRPDQDGANESTACEPALRKAAHDRSNVINSAEWIYNSWNRDSEPPRWQDVLAIFDKPRPGVSRYTFPLGKAMLDLLETRMNVYKAIQTILHRYGITDAIVQPYQEETDIRGVDVTLPEDADIDPSLLKLEYNDVPITYLKTGISLGKGLIPCHIRSVNHGSLNDQKALLDAMNGQLQRRGYVVRCVWSTNYNLGEKIGIRPMFSGTLLMIAELVAEDRKIHGFMRLPQSGQCIVSYLGRGYWCPSCSWRTDIQHEQTEACKAAEQIRRKNSRNRGDLFSPELSLEPLPPRTGTKVPVNKALAASIRRSATPARKRKNTPPPPPEDLTDLMPPPQLPPSTAKLFRGAPRRYFDFDEPLFRGQSEQKRTLSPSEREDNGAGPSSKRRNV